MHISRPAVLVLTSIGVNPRRVPFNHPDYRPSDSACPYRPLPVVRSRIGLSVRQQDQVLTSLGLWLIQKERTCSLIRLGNIDIARNGLNTGRSEEPTSELQSL